MLPLIGEYIAIISTAIVCIYSIVKSIYFFLWKEKNAHLYQRLFELKIEPYEILEKTKPFGLKYIVNFKNMFIQYMTDNNFLVYLSYSYIFNELKKDRENLEYRIISLEQKGGDYPQYQKYSSRLANIDKLLKNLQEMEHSEFLVKYSGFIERDLKKIVVNAEDHVGMKKYDIILSFFLNKNFNNFKKILLDFYDESSEKEVWFLSSSEREFFIENLKKTMNNTAAYFLFKKLYSFGNKKERKKISEYLYNSMNYKVNKGHTIINEDNNDSSYTIRHYLQTSDTNENLYYYFEIEVFNEYLLKRLKALDLQKLVAQQIEKLPHVESIYTYSTNTSNFDDKYKSDKYIIDNPYDAEQLSSLINEEIGTYSRNQETIIKDYVREGVSRNLKNSTNAR